MAIIFKKYNTFSSLNGSNLYLHVTKLFVHRAQTKVRPNIGPRDFLIEKTKSGELLRDELQSKVSEALQVVYENIKCYNPYSNNLLAKLFSRKQVAPKGLYIFGAVGMLYIVFY